MKNALLAVLIIIMGMSCKSSKQLAQDNIYFQNLRKSNLDSNYITFQPKIQKGDILYIGVNSPNETSNKLFNQPNFYGGVPMGGTGANTSAIGYLVNENGEISFPQLGNIKVEGLTRIEISNQLTEKLTKFIEAPVVSVRILNYKITVLGEVIRPGSMSVPNERITILDAIGLAGDLTPFANRTNIKIIREIDGKKELGQINIKDGNIFNSPYYYLHQNDVVYVEMNERKMANVDQANTRNISILLGSVSAIALIITTISNL
jgi:polysaccharide export outer membrane protein